VKTYTESLESRVEENSNNLIGKLGMLQTKLNEFKGDMFPNLENIKELVQAGNGTLKEIAKDLNENRVDRITFQENFRNKLQRIDNSNLQIKNMKVTISSLNQLQVKAEECVNEISGVTSSQAKAEEILKNMI
jgi:DNA repair ATPase RecN